MAINKIKQGRLSRQMHLASAGMRAGAGWAGGQIRTLGLSKENRKLERERLMQLQMDSWIKEIGQLKGSIVKIGQILATYADYCLPAPLASAFHQLEEDTEPLDWSAIAPHIMHSMRENMNELIIDRPPLAAASISQVHTATVRADSRVICLKILYPCIRNTLDSDLSMLAIGLGWSLTKKEQERFSQWIVTIREVMAQEFNLQQEADKLKEWGKRLEGDSRYVIPVVEEKFCSKDILAMSFESGVAPHDRTVKKLPQERRNAIAINMLELFFREIFIWGEMQTDPHSGNYRIRIDKNEGDKIVLLDFGSVRQINADLLQPLRNMILGAYHSDRGSLLEAVFIVGLLDRSAPIHVQQAFTDVLLGLVEPLNYKAKIAESPESVPANAIDSQLNYCWAAANLPKRMGKKAVKSAISQYFSFPNADFLLLSRKLAGVYAFIAALDAKFDASVVLEKILLETSWHKTSHRHM
jgi:predicted unusual protein kinase regulating ubiquinone biosynthesis (AarF/ABC1/UbiB family)